MAFRMLSELFSKEQRAIKRSRIDYSKCEEYNRLTRMEFRKNAVRELSFVYPDIKFLINNHSADFIAYTKNGELTFEGTFADRLIPKIEFVGYNDSLTNRLKAIGSFKRQIENKISVLIPSTWDSERYKYYRDLPDEIKSSMMSKGFYIYRQVHNAFIYGGRMRKDDSVIASSAYWDPKQNGYFSTALFKSVVTRQNRGEKNVSMVGVDIYGLDGHNCIRLTYELFYDDLQRFDNDSGYSNFVNTFSGIADFISTIEPEFRKAPGDVVIGDDSDLEFYRDFLQFY